MAQKAVVLLVCERFDDRAFDLSAFGESDGETESWLDAELSPSNGTTARHRPRIPRSTT